MKFFIKFQKLPGKYLIIDRPNRTQALAVVVPYRNDAIAYAETEKIFTAKEAIEFDYQWEKISIDDLKGVLTNTRKKFILTYTEPTEKGIRVEYKEFRDDELFDYCKAYNKRANFFTVGSGGHQKERFFVLPQKKKENLPLIHIREVKAFPVAQLQGPKEEIVVQQSETRDIEVEVV